MLPAPPASADLRCTRNPSANRLARQPPDEHEDCSDYYEQRPKGRMAVLPQGHQRDDQRKKPEKYE